LQILKIKPLKKNPFKKKSPLSPKEKGKKKRKGNGLP
jgi:hypothetical protein